MPRIPGYNYNIHLEDGFDCCEAELAILKNQTVPAKLDKLESVEDAGDNSYVFVDDGGTKKKVLLKDLINSSLNPQLAEITQRLDVKQDKLVAGDGIKIDGNTISATVAFDPEALKNLVTKEDFDKYSDYIESILVSTNDKLDALSDWLTEVDENKQDKLIAGENITIDENNVISAKGCDCKECTIGVDFITSNEIGSIPAGTEIKADTTLAELLQLILTKPVNDKITLYVGGSLDIPSSLGGLSQYEVSADDMIADSGVVIRTPYVEEGHPFVAYPSEYKLVKWGKADGTFDYTNVLDYVYNVSGYTISYMRDSLFMWDEEDCILKFTQEEL